MIHISHSKCKSIELRYVYGDDVSVGIVKRSSQSRTSFLETEVRTF